MLGMPVSVYGRIIEGLVFPLKTRTMMIQDRERRTGLLHYPHRRVSRYLTRMSCATKICGIAETDKDLIYRNKMSFEKYFPEEGKKHWVNLCNLKDMRTAGLNISKYIIEKLISCIYVSFVLE